jgi:small subunit ribosomal protein S21
MSDQKDRKPITLPENVPVDYNFEKLLKDFLKKVDKNGILKEVKARRYYEKPSAIKRRKEKERNRKK